MQHLQLNISYTLLDNDNELSAEEKTLLLKARQASDVAYAPYSQFKVGAALQLDNGIIITGNNQENVAFPSGLCAERVAIFSAGANYPDVKINTIAITCKSDRFEVNTPLSPCGSCRQSMSEYEIKQKTNIKVILQGETGKIKIINSISDLLPFMFEAEGLKKL